MIAILIAGPRSLRAILAASMIGILAVTSVWAGSLLLRRNQRGVLPSIWLFLVQSIRVIAPIIVWLVSLGWTIDLVLYSAGSEPDVGEVLVALGGHDRPTYLAVNALAAVPFIALVLWRRAAIIASRSSQAQSPAT
jgi:hypothetical protein